MTSNTADPLEHDSTAAMLQETAAFPKDWDEQYLVAEAREAVQQGMDLLTARVIYGPGIVDQALKP